MTLSAFGLVAAAAALHAGWNALTKRAADPLMFLWACLALSCTVLVPAALVVGVDQALTPAAAPLVGASIAIHAVYFYTLTTAYQHGDLSLVYPVARGLGVALVPLGAMVLFAEAPSLPGLVGIALVVVGIGAMALAARARRPETMARVGPQDGAATAHRPRRVARALAWAAATGGLIATYSLVDRAGVQQVHPVVFVALMAVGTELVLLPVVWRRRRQLVSELRTSRRAIAVAWTMTLTSYLLVLFAFRLSKTAYVVAARELSIVLSAVIGGRLLGEGRTTARVAAACVIVAGVVCIVVAE